MDRVSFLIEETGQRLDCLLNPESVEVSRISGVRRRSSVGGTLTGAGLSDDPLLYTSGGMTELKLDLLFDISLVNPTASAPKPTPSPSTIPSATPPVMIEDVQKLTAPFWRLSENTVGKDGYGRPTPVRFLWGKSCNILGVVAAISERLERFTPGGAPTRSWMRMRFLRLDDSKAKAQKKEGSRDIGTSPLSPSETGMTSPRPFDFLSETAEIPQEKIRIHEMVSGGRRGEESGRGSGERLDKIAYDSGGDPSEWKTLARFNGIADPMNIPAGYLLKIPPLGSLIERIT